MALYSGPCGSLTELACDDDGGTGLMPEITQGGLTPGATYFVRFWEYSSGTGTFSICITEYTPPSPPANDDCSGAVSMTMTPYGSCSSASGTVIGATQSSPTACGGTNDDDVWYSFKATSTSAIINRDANFDSYIEVLDGCSGTSIACSDDEGPLVLTGLTINHTYYYRIYSWASTPPDDGTFTTCVNAYPPPPSNDNCSNATTVTMQPYGNCTPTGGSVVGATQSSTTGCSGTNDDDVWYSFVATATSAFISRDANFDSYLEVLDGCSGTSLLCADDEAIQEVTGLTIGNTYYYRIYSYGSTIPANGNFTTCVTAPPPPPTNDNCSSAVSLTVSPNAACNSTFGWVTGATQSAPAACGGTNDDDVWYSFKAINDSVYINRDANFDSYLEVLDGCSGTSILCTDDEGSQLLTGLTVGQTYYYRIYSWSSTPPTDGSFTTCLTSPVPPPDNTKCSKMGPICSDSPIVFMAQSGAEDASDQDPDNNYDCLYSSPNPTWFYLQIANGGNMSIDVTAGSDIDYAIWGPYSSKADAQANCDAYPLPKDCSYSPSEIEQVNVTGVNAGETYVLLVTNYADVPQKITLKSSPSNTATTDCAIVPLPISLIHFTAKQSSMSVELDWKTGSEVNNDYFEIERSIDGTNWLKVDTIDGNGTTSQETTYQSFDRNPKRGISYYRLKQVDFDGKYTYSNVASVDFEGTDAINVFPQPAIDELSVQWNNFNGKLFWFNSQGQRVEVPLIDKSLGYFHYNTKGIAKGIYFIKLENDDVNVTKKVIVE